MPLTAQPPVTLHLGAHRCASTSLQRLLDRNDPDLARAGVSVWTPRKLRRGMLAGVLGDPGRQNSRRDLLAHRAAGRVAMLRDELQQAGITRLVMSEENALGGLRENVLLGRLYPTVAARLARLSGAVPGIDRVCLGIRSPDSWWASTFAFLMTRGFAPPDRATLEAVLRARRGWRQVIEDIAAALPEAEVQVWTYEEMGNQPDATFRLLTGQAPVRAGVPVLNARLGLTALRQQLRDEGCLSEIAGVGDSYAPFSPDERAALRDAHAEDLDWLRQGAGGLATFVTRRAQDPARTGDRKGSIHGARRRRPDGALGAAG